MIGRLGAVASVAISVVAIGCGEEVKHVQIAIAPRFADCGHVPDANTIALTALTESGVLQRNLFAPGEPLISDHWAGDTRQVKLEISVGVPRAIGKTAPFTFDDLGESVPITLIPPDSMCPMGDLIGARRRPQVIAVGDGALVVGGSRFDGGQLLPQTTIEYFDPAVNAFTLLSTPFGLTTGMRGGAIVRLADGRIFFVDGIEKLLTVYDPDLRQFSTPYVGLSVPHALPAVVALDDHRIAVAGGCAHLDPATDYRCPLGDTMNTVEIVDVDSPLNNVAGPDLSTPRANAVATLQYRDGAPVVVVSGGVDDGGNPVAAVDVIPLTGVPDLIPGGAAGPAVPLDGGSTLTAFVPPGATAAAAASVAIAGVPDMRAIDLPPARTGAVLVPLEDGTAIALGGRDGAGLPAPPVVYDPLGKSWTELVDAPTPDLIDHGAARLADGSVLIVGGTDAAGNDSAAAWRFRPPLVGPFEAGVTFSTEGTNAGVELTALDPALVDRGDGGYHLTAQGTIENLALMSGLRTDHATLTADLAVASGTVALIAGATGPGDRLEVVLAPGAQARVDRIAAGVRTTVAACLGRQLPNPLTGPFTLTVDDGRLDVARDGAGSDLGCDAGTIGVGLWGIAAIGDGTRIDVHTIDVQR